jgi:predicted methyltransferase
MTSFPAPMIRFSRRGVLAGATALAACGRKGPREAPKAAGGSGRMTLDQAVAGDWRNPADRVRDRWRRPAQSLAFWGVAPGKTVVEFWPGAGWYTKLYAANLDPEDPAAIEVVDAYRRRLKARPDLYGDVNVTAFGSTSGPVAPAGSADVVLFLRNLHNWMAAGIAEKAFRDAYAALKPGGVLGVEEHRANPGPAQDPLADSGYVQQAYAIQLAQEAGFVFDKASEINANPKDTKDHPFGVWTLPPVRRSSPRGQPEDPKFNHAKYDAIGESDRMTLRFVKPR